MLTEFPPFFPEPLSALISITCFQHSTCDHSASISTIFSQASFGTYLPNHFAANNLTSPLCRPPFFPEPLSALCRHNPFTSSILRSQPVLIPSISAHSCLSSTVCSLSGLTLFSTVGDPHFSKENGRFAECMTLRTLWLNRHDSIFDLTYPPHYFPLPFQ